MGGAVRRRAGPGRGRRSIVDAPQPVALQYGLAPDGWAVSGYESLANLTLSSTTDPTSLSDRVNGLPAARVSVPDPFADPGSGRRTWHLSARFADGGPLFLFQAPDTLTREDVLAMADGITYTP